MEFVHFFGHFLGAVGINPDRICDSQSGLEIFGGKEVTR
jgi:hypothetical protein